MAETGRQSPGVPAPRGEGATGRATPAEPDPGPRTVLDGYRYQPAVTTRQLLVGIAAMVLIVAVLLLWLTSLS